MLYTHMDIWETPTDIMHALYRPGTRELTVGRLRSYEVDRRKAWAKAHNIVVNDKRMQGWDRLGSANYPVLADDVA